MNAIAPRPLVPGDLPANKILIRAVVAHAVSASRVGTRPEQIAREFWPRDAASHGFVERAAVSGATTTQSGWASQLVGSAVGAFIGSLQDNSAAAALISAAPRFNMPGYGQIVLPRASSTGTPGWISEADPIPAGAGVIAGPILGPPRKLGLIEAYTGELARRSAEDVETIIGLILRTAMARQLDLSLYSAVAADATRPAGILNGVTPATATIGGGLTAALGDVRALTDAIVAGGGGSNILFFASVGRALTLKGYAPALAGQVYGSASIDPEMLVGVDSAAFASMFGSEPELMVTKEVAIHYEDTTPLNISSPGSPSTVAAPVREAFQTNVIVIRAILDCAWVMRVPGAISFIETGMTW